MLYVCICVVSTRIRVKTRIFAFTNSSETCLPLVFAVSEKVGNRSKGRRIFLQCATLLVELSAYLISSNRVSKRLRPHRSTLTIPVQFRQHSGGRDACEMIALPHPFFLHSELWFTEHFSICRKWMTCSVLRLTIALYACCGSRLARQCG